MDSRLPSVGEGAPQALLIGRIAPAARKQKASKSTFLLTDSSTNKAISVTVWETEHDMLAGEASGYLKGQIEAASTFAAPPTAGHRQLSIHGALVP